MSKFFSHLLSLVCHPAFAVLAPVALTGFIGVPQALPHTPQDIAGNVIGGLVLLVVIAILLGVLISRFESAAHDKLAGPCFLAVIFIALVVVVAAVLSLLQLPIGFILWSLVLVLPALLRLGYRMMNFSAGAFLSIYLWGGVAAPLVGAILREIVIYALHGELNPYGWVILAGTITTLVAMAFYARIKLNEMCA